jgi:hypothetical protein
MKVKIESSELLNLTVTDISNEDFDNNILPWLEETIPCFSCIKKYIGDQYIHKNVFNNLDDNILRFEVPELSLSAAHIYLPTESDIVLFKLTWG